MRDLRTRLCLLTLAAVLAMAATAAAAPPSPPAVEVRAGSDPHQSFFEASYGHGDTEYWLFEPRSPEPESAPLVLFLHGWSAMEPTGYADWLEHLARRGNVVIYPRYQASLLSPPAAFHSNVVAAFHAALEELAKPGHVHPDLARFAIVGHSAGGAESATFAALAHAERLPVPRAVMAVEPGRGGARNRGRDVIPLADPAQIPADVELVLVVGDRDQRAGSATARDIFRRAVAVRRRTFVTMQSDDHGTPPLLANHFAPAAGPHARVDALDVLGFWRLFDQLTDAAFAGRDFVVDPAMGHWSDGTPIKPLVVETAP